MLRPATAVFSTLFRGGCRDESPARSSMSTTMSRFRALPEGGGCYGSLCHCGAPVLKKRASNQERDWWTGDEMCRPRLFPACVAIQTTAQRQAVATGPVHVDP